MALKVRLLGLWRDQCPRYRNFHALQEVVDAHARRGTPRSQCFSLQVMRLPRGGARCRVCQISAKPWIPRIAGVAKSICDSGEFLTANLPRPRVEPGLPYGASKTKTGKILYRNTNPLFRGFARKVVEKYCFAAHSATNLPQILERDR